MLKNNKIDSHSASCRKFIRRVGVISFGNLANFCLGTWPIFVWELGRFLFGNLAKKSLHPIRPKPPRPIAILPSSLTPAKNSPLFPAHCSLITDHCSLFTTHHCCLFLVAKKCIFAATKIIRT